MMPMPFSPLRLQRDVAQSGNAQLQAKLSNLPKALLPLGLPSKKWVLLDYWIALIDRLGEQEEKAPQHNHSSSSSSNSSVDVRVCLISNNYFYPQLAGWWEARRLRRRRQVGGNEMENATSGTTTTTTTTSTTSASADIFNDGTDSNETRLGAIMDLKLGLDHFLGVTGGGGGGGEVSPRANSTAADVLVIAGDTLFLNDFSLDRFLRLARHLNNNNIIQNNNNGGGGAILVSVVELEDENGTYKSGILELDDSLCIRVDDEEKKEENKKATTNNKTTSLFPLTSCKRVVKFLEKPGPLATKSRLSCPCFYYLPFSAIHLLSLFISEKTTGGAGGGDTRPRLEDVDATGKFVEWLINDYGKMPVYAVQASGRLDIGGLESYLIADKYLMAG